MLKEKPNILVVLVSAMMLMNCSSGGKDNVVIQNSRFRWEIGKDGRNISFTDRSSGNDYLDKKNATWCGYVSKGGNRYPVNSVARKGKHIILKFTTPGVTADILTEKENDRLKFTVNEVTGDPESLNFINVPLILEGMPYEPFGTCVLAMNLFTHVRQIPALQTSLWATCYKQFGLKGSQIMLLCVKPSEMLPLIRDVISHASDIPFSDKGGAWALTEKEGYGSYLMNFGTLTEETADEWIKMCKSLGFNQIDNHGGGSFFRFGEFELNSEKWPDGWESFRRINEKLHSAGISSIFHTYAFFIDKSSKYVTPVPSEDLAYFRTFTLAEPLDDKSTEVVVNEPTPGISTVTGFFVRNSTTLRVGHELIEFSGVTSAPPYKFTGCKRGACNTNISVHLAGDTAFHLKETLGRFVPGPETGLFSEMARRHAEIVNQCRFDGIYFDAIDGADILGGDENFWYYGTKFLFEVAKNLDRPIGMEMSSMSHLWWHYRSRWQAWDRPVRGYKKFIDIHSAAIKSPRLFLPLKMVSNENEHGRWRGNTPLIDKYAGADNGSLLLPLHLGWWGNQTWNPPQVEPTFPDDVEYLCCKLIGNNAGLSMLGGMDEKTISENPLFGRLLPIFRQYEELRHENYFSDSIRALLRQPGREFTLFKDESGRWNFKPVIYAKHKVAGTDHPSSEWVVNNEFRAQPVRFRFELLMSVRPYDDPASKILANFSGSKEFMPAVAANGVKGGIDNTTAECKKLTSAGRFYATASGLVAREGQWIKSEKEFSPWLDLSGNQGLGVWVNGDGNGELLDLRLESPNNLSHGAHGDHFIKIDFSGWRYFELIEIESSDYSNYLWPDSGFYVYDSYRHTILFDKINKLQLWYNNLPSGKEVNCSLGPVKALPLVSSAIYNPAVIINGQKLTIPVKMESGMCLEFASADNCRLYGPRGELLQEIKTGIPVPMMKEGENKISFECEGSAKINPRVQVTVISEGEPIIR